VATKARFSTQLTREIHFGRISVAKLVTISVGSTASSIVFRPLWFVKSRLNDCASKHTAVRGSNIAETVTKRSLTSTVVGLGKNNHIGKEERSSVH